jgi:bifunctional ADP-heptose synthase (sugar kinase/adenylyltransferase)
LFEEDTPLNLISTLLPDVLVKGADYQIENIAGAKEVIANGGEVKTITFVDGYSSTAIINKIKG